MKLTWYLKASCLKIKIKHVGINIRIWNMKWQKSSACSPRRSFTFLGCYTNIWQRIWTCIWQLIWQRGYDDVYDNGYDNWYDNADMTTYMTTGMTTNMTTDMTLDDNDNGYDNWYDNADMTTNMTTGSRVWQLIWQLIWHWMTTDMTTDVTTDMTTDINHITTDVCKLILMRIKIYCIYIVTAKQSREKTNTGDIYIGDLDNMLIKYPSYKRQKNRTWSCKNAYTMEEKWNYFTKCYLEITYNKELNEN